MSDGEIERTYCKMPIVPESKFPLGFPTDAGMLIMLMESKWVNGTLLTYCFLDQPPKLAGGEVG